MKYLRFLGVPTMVVGMLVLLTATAYANHAQIDTKLDCASATRVCFDLTVSTTEFPQGGRDITVTLLGHRKGDADAKHLVTIGQPQTVHLAQGLQNAHIPPVCFDSVTTADFDSFALDIAAVGSQFDVNGRTEVTTAAVANTCSTAQVNPPGGGSSGSGSGGQPPASTTQTLAKTGGFDFRYPLIGLALLVAGAALLVVSASRRRSASAR